MPNKPEEPPPSQYRDSRNLAARGRLHVRYGTRNWFDWVADQLGLSPGAHILDIGCGPGWFWEKAAPTLPEGLSLTLADKSEGMVAEATERLSSNKHLAAVRGEPADVVALPFAEASFDAVIAMHMLYHVPDLDQALNEMARVLRPNGRLLVTTVGRQSMAPLYGLTHRAFGTPAIDPAASMFDIDDASALLGTRFERIDVERYQDEFAITDPEDVYAYLTSMPPGIDAGDDQQAMLRGLIDEAFKAHNGTLHAVYEAGLIIGSGRQ